MDIFLAEQGLSFTYLRDPSQNAGFDPCRILDDLCGDGMAGAMLPRENGLRMAGSDHLVLATGTTDGRYVGALAASDVASEREPFLFLDAAYMAPAVRASYLLHRMLAFAMLRIGGDAAVPNVIAACVQTPCYASSLREFGQRFSVAAMFPAAPEDVVIDLGMASLARRIARVVRPGSRCEAANGVVCSATRANAARHAGGISNGIPNGAHGGSHRMEETLVIVDLSVADEATILNDARKLYRARSVRGTRRAGADVVMPVMPALRRRLRGATAL